MLDTDTMWSDITPKIHRLARIANRRRHHPVLDEDDLIQEGWCGAMDAALAYKATHGANFSTYADRRIRGAIQDAFRRFDTVERSYAHKRDDPKILARAKILHNAMTQPQYRTQKFTIEDRTAIRMAVSTLPPRMKIMIYYYYVEQREMWDVGRMMGITESMVSRLHTATIQRLQIVLRTKEAT